MSRKAQVWILDLIGGVVIFLIVIIAYFIFVNNISDFNKSNFAEMFNDAGVVSDSILSAGNPPDWDITNVESVGITEGDYRLNTAKYRNMSAFDYFDLKLLLKTKYEYLIFLENKSNEVLTIGGVDYIGKPGLDKDNVMQIEKPKTLISVKRLLIYDSDIITMVVYLWQ